jgi:4-azaleucine resistance transporter AzlC
LLQKKGSGIIFFGIFFKKDGDILLHNKTFSYAFQKSLPVLFGYLFLGAAFGVMLQNAGYNSIWAFFISLTVFAGSGQFLLVSLLSTGASLPVTAAMTLLINSRHIFYGLSFLERFKKTGKKYPYMIFSLTDETYSVLCSVKETQGVNEGTAMFLIAFLNHLYWIAGGILGALLGEFLPVNFTGIDFSMTALFVVLFIEQWLEFKTHLPAITGFVVSLVFLIILGPDQFILPSLLVTVTILLACRSVIGPKQVQESAYSQNKEEKA